MTLFRRLWHWIRTRVLHEYDGGPCRVYVRKNHGQEEFLGEFDDEIAAHDAEFDFVTRYVFDTFDTGEAQVFSFRREAVRR